MGFTHLSPSELKAARTHKYNKFGVTLLEPYIDPPLNRLAQLIPRAITPNQLTFAGFTTLVLSILALAYWNSSLVACGTYPSYLYLIAATGVFLGNLFDCVDGKHARNTKQSSPVGMWLDHGFDAYSLTFFFIHGALATGARPGVDNLQEFLTLLSLVTIQIQWFMVHWEESITGKFRFPLFADVEGSVMVAGANLIAFAFPCLTTTVILFHAGKIPITISFVLTCVTFMNNMQGIITGLYITVRHIVLAPEGRRVLAHRAFSSIAPPIYYAGLTIALAFYAPNLFRDYNLLCILAAGAIFATVALRQILCNLCAESAKHFSFVQPVVLPLAFAVLNAVLKLGFRDELVLWAVFIHAAGYYAFTMCSIYCQVLGVYGCGRCADNAEEADKRD